MTVWLNSFKFFRCSLEKNSSIQSDSLLPIFAMVLRALYRGKAPNAFGVNRTYRLFAPTPTALYVWGKATNSILFEPPWHIMSIISIWVSCEVWFNKLKRRWRRILIKNLIFYLRLQNIYCLHDTQGMQTLAFNFFECSLLFTPAFVRSRFLWTTLLRVVARGEVVEEVWV